MVILKIINIITNEYIVCSMSRHYFRGVLFFLVEVGLFVCLFVLELYFLRQKLSKFSRYVSYFLFKFSLSWQVTAFPSKLPFGIFEYRRRFEIINMPLCLIPYLAF